MVNKFVLWTLRGKGHTQVLAQSDSEDGQGHRPSPSQVDTSAGVEVQITSVRPVAVCISD